MQDTFSLRVTHLPDLVMTISVPCLWNSIQRSLDSRQILGSSLASLPPCRVSEGPLQVKDDSAARVIGASRLASAGPWGGKVTSDNSEGPAKTRWRDTAVTLPGTNGPEKSRMMSKRGTFYARPRLSCSGSRVNKIALILFCRFFEKGYYQRSSVTIRQTESSASESKLRLDSFGLSVTPTVGGVLHNYALKPLVQTQTDCRRFSFSGKWN